MATFDRDGEMMTLCDLRPGQTAEVVAIATEDDGRLMKLAALGLAPGSFVRLQQRFPTYVVWVGETLLSLEQAVAADIWLRPPEDGVAEKGEQRVGRRWR